MEDKIYNLLRKMRTIEPDRAFSARARAHILASRKKSWYIIMQEITHMMRMREFAALTLMVIMVTGYLIHDTKSTNLIVEADEVNSAIQVKLREIQYLIKNQGVVNEETAQKIETLLNNATEELERASTESKNPEEALRKIKETGKILKELETLLSK